jgi:hypothetical protein
VPLSHLNGSHKADYDHTIVSLGAAVRHALAETIIELYECAWNKVSRGCSASRSQAAAVTVAWVLVPHHRSNRRRGRESFADHETDYFSLS